MSEREFDIVVVGASGLTGRLVAGEIARYAQRFTERSVALRWAVSGRDPDRTRTLLEALEGGAPAVLHADLADVVSLPSLTRSAAVILNLAGPYTQTAQGLIAACVGTGTHYVDLSGEIPLLRDVIAQFHQAALETRVRIVQMAGWEASPADLATLLASRRASGGAEEGPGAGGAVAEVTVAARFQRTPEGRLPLSQAVSAGTLRSIVQILEAPEARLIARTDALLPSDAGDQSPPRYDLRPFRIGAACSRPLRRSPF